MNWYRISGYILLLSSVILFFLSIGYWFICFDTASKICAILSLPAMFFGFGIIGDE